MQHRLFRANPRSPNPSAGHVPDEEKGPDAGRVIGGDLLLPFKKTQDHPPSTVKPAEQFLSLRISFYCSGSHLIWGTIKRSLVVVLPTARNISACWRGWVEIEATKRGRNWYTTQQAIKAYQDSL